jgi:hypothetical protein
MPALYIVLALCLLTQDSPQRIHHRGFTTEDSPQRTQSAQRKAREKQNENHIRRFSLESLGQKSH